MLYDKDIREPLFEFLEETYGKIRIIEEKRIGKTRADVMMITPDSIWGIEIKSDADTYARLSRQVKDYDKYYDYNYVVVGSSHALHIREHIPDYWGVISVELVGEQFDFNSDKCITCDHNDISTGSPHAFFFNYPYFPIFFFKKIKKWLSYIFIV